jgi:lysozyme family protein
MTSDDPPFQGSKLGEIDLEEGKTKPTPETTNWWGGSQITILLIGGIVTLLGNIGLAYYNGLSSRAEESLKARHDLDLEREKAKADLILQAIASNDPGTAKRNILFFIQSGLIDDPKGKIARATSRYLPVLPSATGAGVPAITPEDYGEAFWAVTIPSDRIPQVDHEVDAIVKGRNRLETVGRSVKTPWYVVGVLWIEETGGRFDVHLHNGDPLTARTVHPPAGRPLTGQPPFKWEDSAIDALTLAGFTNLDGKDLITILTKLEQYNGNGYQAHQISSPYLWGATSGYSAGKFTADATFDPNATSKQIGAVALLRRLDERGVIKLDESTGPAGGDASDAP